MSHDHRPGLLAGALIMLLAGCAAARPVPPTGAAPGTWKSEAGMLKNGAKRPCLLHVPTGYQAGRDYPLAVVLRGAFSTAREMED